MRRLATVTLALAFLVPATLMAAGRNGNCGRCGGGITEMTLRYVGSVADAHVQVYQNDRSTRILLFDDVVQPDGELTIEGKNRRGTLEPVIHIFVNGRLDTPIPTSCEFFGAGLRRGHFEVVEAESVEGGKVCPEGDDDDGEDDEEGCCEGQVDELTLRYTGEVADAQVKVTQKVGKRQVTLFDEVVQPGGEFTFDGGKRDKTMGPVIQVFVDGELNTRIKTSCDEEIGPGLVSGDFEVVAGTSRVGGELCPVEDDGEDGEPACAECDGQVTTLTLLYTGDVGGAQVRVVQRDGSRRVTVFNDTVEPGGQFTFTGKNRRGTLGANILIYVNGGLNARIHTSCSEPIGPGLVRGDFEVMEGASRNGGMLCTVSEQ